MPIDRLPRDIAGFIVRHIRSVERAAIGRRTSENEIDLLAILAPKGRTHA